MEKTYQVPFRVEYPGAGELLDKLLKEQNITEDWQEKKVLILHQQVLANELRKEIKERSGHTAKVTVCSYFMMHKEWMEETDRKLREEDDWVELLTKENYNIILADTTLSVMTPDFDGQWINLPSFAISGKYDPSM
jgi:nitrogenase molybdenum-cofactor synthesis protein NifE